jgi:hypothetical protein
LIGGIVNKMGGPSGSDALVYGIAVVPIALALGTAGFVLLFAIERKKQTVDLTN